MMRYLQVKEEKKQKFPYYVEASKQNSWPQLTRKEGELRNVSGIFQGAQDSEFPWGSVVHMFFSKGLVKASAWIVLACCWLCPQMIKSLHCFSCPGSFIEAAVNPNTGKVPALSLSSQILSIHYRPQGVEIQTQTPPCRCSVDGWRAHSCGQSAWLRLYEKAASRVRGIIGIRLTSSISWDGVFIFFRKKSKHQLQSPYITLVFWTSLHWGTQMGSVSVAPSQTKTPRPLSSSYQYIFMQGTVAKDYSESNWCGRVY